MTSLTLKGRLYYSGLCGAWSETSKTGFSHNEGPMQHVDFLLSTLFEYQDSEQQIRKSEYAVRSQSL